MKMGSANGLFKNNNKIIDIFDHEDKYLTIFSRDILKKIKKGNEEWQDDLPEGIADQIIKEKMFGYNNKE